MNPPPARTWSRLIAFLLDYLVIAAYIVLITLLSQMVMGTSFGLPLTRFLADPFRADLFAFLILVLPVILYFSVAESGPWLATWGKRSMRLCVMDEKGGRLTFPRSLLRSVVKFLPWQIAHTSLFHIPGWPMEAVAVPTASMIGFGLVWAMVLIWFGFLIFHPAHRTPYDLAAGSRVVASTFTARPS